MQREDVQKLKLPDTPGVYVFRGPKREVLYVGKATSLRDRVRSYFANDLVATRGGRIVTMVEKAKTLTHEETDSVLEALIFEAQMIKKHQPPYNVRDKDNKSFNYLVITKEDFPRILLVRGRELFQEWDEKDIKHLFGPFPEGGALKIALKIVRKIFPYRDKCSSSDGKLCFNAQIGLCPGVCNGEVSKAEYARTVRNIALLFSGKKTQLLKTLTKEMEVLARKEKFEKAAELKRQVYSLEHIRDVALINDPYRYSGGGGNGREFRIEAYDVAHTSGTNPVGVMTVVIDGKIDKKEYRTFTIKSVTNNDVAALKEVLERRLGHSEWQYPRLIVVDGGKAQINIAEKVLQEHGVQIPVVAVVKDERHKPKGIVGDKHIITIRETPILLANGEAHRFSIGLHRKKRDKIA